MIKKVLSSNWLFLIVLLVFAYRQYPSIRASFQNEGKPVKVFQAKNLDNQFVSLNPIGERRVLLFWATWCAPCHVQFEILEKTMDSKLINDKRVIALNMSESTKVIKKFKTKNKLPFHAMLDIQGISRQLNILSTPSVVFIDEKGIVDYQSSGISPLLGLRINSFLK